jgi:hypothetical protein
VHAGVGQQWYCSSVTSAVHISVSISTAAAAAAAAAAGVCRRGLPALVQQPLRLETSVSCWAPAGAAQRGDEAAWLQQLRSHWHAADMPVFIFSVFFLFWVLLGGLAPGAAARCLLQYQQLRAWRCLPVTTCICRCFHTAAAAADSLLLLLSLSVNLQRYICWMHTTPAVLYLIKSVSNSITTQQVGARQEGERQRLRLTSAKG